MTKRRPKKSDRDRAEAMEQAKRGELNEYYLQRYFRDNHLEFDVTDLSGPFETGYDFTGKVLGERVVIECERRPADFVIHGYKSDDVDVLVFMVQDDTPRNLIPKIMIWVDPEDLVDRAYMMESKMAIMATREEVDHEVTARMILVAEALYSLWNICREGVSEGTEESRVLNEAVETVAPRYLDHYDLGWHEPYSEEVDLPEIILIENRVLMSGTEQLSAGDLKFLSQWMDLLDDEISRMV